MDGHEDFEISNYHINVSGFWSILAILRNFGPFINFLKISITDASAFDYETIGKFVNDYCYNSLRELWFYNSTFNIARLFTRPFANLKILFFQWCFINNDLFQLNKWFPSVEYINFCGWNNFERKQTISIDFVRLTELFTANDFVIVWKERMITTDSKLRPIQIQVGE